MKRQNYFPRRMEGQPTWLLNYANALAIHAPNLSISSTDTGASMDDARWAAYGLGIWLAAVRAFSPASTDAVDALLTGTGDAVMTLPTFTVPALPSGVTARKPGALTRIFAMVARIKLDPAYTEAMGTDLGIIGAEDAGEHPVPKFNIEVQQVGDAQVVRIGLFKYGHMAVYIESRRGGGAWEFLAIATDSPHTDERPLLAPGTPEVREYRMSFWDNGAPNGVWSAVEKVTVSP